MVNPPKIFLGPMSLNVVDAVIDYNISRNSNFGFIPSRRQVEFNGGYVHNWTSEGFSSYVKSKSSSTIIMRDHSGPGQGYLEDDGLKSLENDSKFFDLIHIDPWKKYPTFKEGLDCTIKLIKYCDSISNNVLFEVGTEEAIRPFSADDILNLLIGLQKNLSEVLFQKIRYVVVQSGVGLDLGNMKNIGSFRPSRLSEMVKIAQKFDKLTKEHNGDYLSAREIGERFSIGLDSINIAPELGQIETCAIIELLKKENSMFIDQFFKICYDSKRWVKWVSSDFKPYSNKEELIKICGHYTFSQEDFSIFIKSFLKDASMSKKDFSNVIKSHIRSHLSTISKF